MILDSNDAQAGREVQAQQAPRYARDWCFFLDIDGTLLEFAERPDAVQVDSRLKNILSRLQEATCGAVALISGRPVGDIDRLFSPLRFAAAGQHGIERRNQAGELFVHAAPTSKLADAVDVLQRLVAQHSGLVLENKGATLAMHYRLAPQLGPRVREVMREVRDLLGEQFVLQAGKMLLEIKPGGKDKGTAIAEFMAESPFRGRVPVFVGDDLTDEYGFAAVNRLHGHALKVGPGSTVARWRLPDANAVQTWLEEYTVQYPASARAERK